MRMSTKEKVNGWKWMAEWAKHNGKKEAVKLYKGMEVAATDKP